MISTNKKHIVSLVTNDLHQDQRMNRICTSLANNGFSVTLVGRKLKTSTNLPPMNFERKRLRCFFNKGFVFYAEYNIRLFFYLLFTSYDIINANDLDTILPAVMVGQLKNTPVVYDAHEYFTEQEEVVNRPRIKAVWKWVERFAIPKTANRYTVSQGYADLFSNEYNLNFGIVRNATVLKDYQPVFPKDSPFILYQGAVNYGRGLHIIIEAMKNVSCKLIICGTGDLLEELKNYTAQLNLSHKVEFTGFVEPAKLIGYTRGATIGLTVFEKEGLSHWHSLANRFFDYMHAGVPQLAMNYPEYKKFNSEFEIAVLLNSLTAEEVSEKINLLLTNTDLFEKLSNNALEARKIANWQTQESVLIQAYQGL